MPAKRNTLPSYLHHQQSGRARVYWLDRSNQRHEKLLPGEYGSEESKRAYAELVAELAAAPHAVERPDDREPFSVAELLLAFRLHALEHYRTSDGSPSDEVRHLDAACRHVREVYGLIPADEFGPLCLKAVRQRFVAAGWCRKTVNARVDRIRRVFRWGVAEELVKPETLQALAAVDGLKRGRTTAPESAAVVPVADAVVDATRPHLNRHVRGLVQFQRLTGCRPSEACAVRRCDIDMSGAVWFFALANHKTAWKGKARTVAIGPKAQELLREFFTSDVNDYLFSPRRAAEEHRAERATKRRTPRYPSHMKRNVAKRVGNRKRPPSDRYTRESYLTAIVRGCERAFPPVGQLARQEKESASAWWNRLTEQEKNAVRVWRREHCWHPNQLRHLHGTRVRKHFSLEHAGAALGHTKMSATEIYAERDAGLAAEVAAKLG